MASSPPRAAATRGAAARGGPSSSPLADPSSLYMNAGARKLYDAVVADASAQHFKVLPDIILFPAYYEVIARPVSLADINMAINSGSRYSVEDMSRDVRRMIVNAKKYNLPDSQVYADALTLERLVRKAAKELEREGDLDSDEDVSYQRSNKDRAYYESLEVGQAQQWSSQLAVRRDTQAALRAHRAIRATGAATAAGAPAAPAAATAAFPEDSLAHFVDDPDLFRRGVENVSVFHARKLGRWQGQAGPVPMYTEDERTDALDASDGGGGGGGGGGSSGGASAAAVDAIAGAGSEPLASGRKRCGGGPEGGSSSGGSAVRSSTALPPGAGDAPGTFFNPTGVTARAEYSAWLRASGGGPQQQLQQGADDAGTHSAPASAAGRLAASGGGAAASSSRAGGGGGSGSDSDDSDGYAGAGGGRQRTAARNGGVSSNGQTPAARRRPAALPSAAAAGAPATQQQRAAPPTSAPSSSPPTSGGIRSGLAAAASFLAASLSLSSARPAPTPAPAAPAVAAAAAASLPATMAAAAAAAPSTSTVVSKRDAAIAARAAADAAGTDVFLRVRLGGELLAPPLKARVPASLVPPPQGSHRRACRLCAPSLLEGPVVGRKGTDDAGGSLASLSRHHPEHGSSGSSGSLRCSAHAGEPAGSSSASSAGGQHAAPGGSARKRSASVHTSVDDAAAAAAAAAPAVPPGAASHDELDVVLVPQFRVLSTAQLQGVGGHRRSANSGSGGGGVKIESHPAAAAAAAKRARTAGSALGGGVVSPPRLDMALVKAANAGAAAVSIDAAFGAPGGGSGRGLAHHHSVPASSPAVFFGLGAGGSSSSRPFAPGGGSSSSSSPSAPTVGASADSANPKYQRLAKLSRELGTAIAVDASRLQSPPTAAQAAAAAAAAPSASSASAAAAAGPACGGGSSSSRIGAGYAALSTKSAQHAAAAAAASAAAGDDGDDGDDDDDDEDGTSGQQQQQSRAGGRSVHGAASSGRAAPPLDPKLDSLGYNARISAAFREAYFGSSASINSAPECVPTLLLQAARRKRSTHIGAPPSLADAAAAASGGVSGSSSDAYGHHPLHANSASAGAASTSHEDAGYSSYSLGRGSAAGAAASSSSSSSSRQLAHGWAPHEPVISDTWRFEKWLIRKRLHYCETHGSDSAKVSPIVEWFTPSYAPYAGLLLQVLEEERVRLQGAPATPVAGSGAAVAAVIAAAAAVVSQPPIKKSHKKMTPAQKAASLAERLARKHALSLLKSSGAIAGGGGGKGAALKVRAATGVGPPYDKAYAGASAVASAIMKRGGTIPPSLAPSLAAFTTGGNTAKLVAAAAASKPNRAAGRKRKRIYAGYDDSEDEDGADEAMGAAAVAFAFAFCPSQLGTMLDVQDSSGQWWLGQVIDVRQRRAGDDEEEDEEGDDEDERGSPSSSAAAAAAAAAPIATTEVCVHYQGWPDEYDEWVALPPGDVLAAILDEAKRAASKAGALAVAPGCSMAVKDCPPALLLAAGLGAAGGAPTPAAPGGSPGAGAAPAAAAAAPKLTPALRAAMAASRVAPPMTRSELLLSSSLCAGCANKRGAGTLVFCDAPSCGKAFHLGCHKPPLAKVPSGRWTCSSHASSGSSSSSSAGGGGSGGGVTSPKQ